MFGFNMHSLVPKYMYIKKEFWLMLPEQIWAQEISYFILLISWLFKKKIH